MKAVVKTMQGYDHMRYMNLPEPEPSNDLVKLKVAYSGICGTDLHAFQGFYQSICPPIVLGHEFSGIVTAVGSAVKNIKIGDRITSETTFQTCHHCPMCRQRHYNLCPKRKGIGTQVNGSMAEYLLTPESSVHRLPSHISLLAGALAEPIACGVHAVKEQAFVKAGDVCLIFGAGMLGQMVAQVAKNIGATVILAGLLRDEKRLRLAREQGIRYCVNQERENLEEMVLRMTNYAGADHCFECAGSAPALQLAFTLVKRKGTVVQMGIFPRKRESLPLHLLLQKEVVYIGSRSQKPSSWHLALSLLEKGICDPAALVTSVRPLKEWRIAFDEMLQGTEAKCVLVADPALH